VSDVSDRYREGVREAMDRINRAYLATSVPAPHPVWWKRLLRRPYRKGDPAAYMRELQRLHRGNP
jgi:hypothetical protein